MNELEIMHLVFRGLLGRDPEPASAAYLQAQVAAGRPLESLIEEVGASGECRNRLRGEAAPLLVPPGHYYSPVCDPAVVAPVYRDPGAVPPETHVAGIALRPDAQFRLFEMLRPTLQAYPFPVQKEEGWRYDQQSPHFGPGDAAILHAMLCWLRPRRYVELGPGRAAAPALDIVERFLDRRTDVLFIHPEQQLIPEGDEGFRTWRAISPRDVEPELWASLQPNDVLFVDSSHVVKTGSDVLTILFDILPRLRAGVVVAIHSVFFPFEYPPHWVLDENRSWNELYALRAFLTNNQDWEILFFNDYFRRLAPRMALETCPLYATQPGSSLWLRRT